MKVLHLSSEASWRGGEQQIAYLAEALQQQSVEVMIACRQGSPVEVFCQEHNISHHSLPFRNSLDIYSAWKIRQLCRRWQPDILHAHSSKSHSLTWLASHFGSKAPIVLSRRVAFPIRRSSLNIKKYNHPLVRRVLCVTESVKEKVVPLLADPSKAVVIHDGVDLSQYTPHSSGQTNYLKERYQLPENAFLVGTTAAFTKEKDYPTFLYVAKKVIKNAPEQEVFFIAMGEGSERSDIEALAKKLNIDHRIIFTGFIPEAKSLLGGLDLFLFTSTNEGLGSSLLDAFASGTAVVATKAGGIPEIVSHEETGLLAPVGDFSLLADHVQRLWEDAGLRNRLAQAALRYVQEFDKNVIAQKTLEVYQDILQE